MKTDLFPVSSGVRPSRLRTRLAAALMPMLVYAAGSVWAQPLFPNPVPRVDLTFLPGSSVKLEQLIGDKDWATGKLTASQTISRYHIEGTDLGFSFESNGKVIFLFGDTLSSDKSTYPYGAQDPIAWSTSTDPQGPLLLNFYTNGDGLPLFVDPPGVPMGVSDTPSTGITLEDGIYLVLKTGVDNSLDNPNQFDYSVLARFDEAGGTFSAVRTLSRLPGGHFITTALHAFGPDILLYGVGDPGGSDVDLAWIPAGNLASGEGTRYFAGLVNGQPIWTSSEADAAPVVQDNPLGGPPWPNDSPTIGKVSVIYCADLRLWLMTYNGGRQKPKTTGVYFSYALAPWGPWSQPELIFNNDRDKGDGVFIHDPSIVPDPPGDGLNGPVPGDNDPYSTAGFVYAPFLIERFTRVIGDRLTICYTMSTANPYTVVRMQSEFKITREIPRVVSFR